MTRITPKKVVEERATVEFRQVVLDERSYAPENYEKNDRARKDNLSYVHPEIGRKEEISRSDIEQKYKTITTSTQDKKKIIGVRHSLRLMLTRRSDSTRNQLRVSFFKFLSRYHTMFRI